MTAEAVIRTLGALGFSPAPPKEKDIGKWFVIGRRGVLLDRQGMQFRRESAGPVWFDGIEAVRIEGNRSVKPVGIGSGTRNTIRRGGTPLSADE